MEMTPFKIAVVSCSWLLSIYLVWILWRSEQHVFFKVSLTVLVWIPVLGPLLFWWISDFPSKVHPMFRDRSRYSSDVFDRWRAVHSDSDPQRRLGKWIAQVKRDQKENPHDPL
jgi:hypothetical protein